MNTKINAADWVEVKKVKIDGLNQELHWEKNASDWTIKWAPT